MTYTRLALTAAALAIPLHMAQAQSPVEQRRFHLAPAADQLPILVADMMSEMGQGGGPAQPGAAPMSPGMQAQPTQTPPAMPMMDDKMHGKSSGGMPMMDDKMEGKSSGGMPMMDDKMGGMPAQGACGPAGAQSSMERMMSMMGSAMMNMRGMAAHGGMTVAPYEHVEGRIAFLQAELAITDAQMPQWHAFADAMRSAAKSMHAAVAAQAGGTPVSAPERGERQIQLLTARLEAMRTVHAAGTALYAVLSDDQKKIADELMVHPMRQM